MSTVTKTGDVAGDDLPSNLALAADNGIYHFRLYVAGRIRKCMAAIANLTLLCEARLPGRRSIEVFDFALNSESAAADQILAIPTTFLVGVEYSRVPT